MSLQAANLGTALLGRTREAVIGLLFTDPAQGLHVREIARRTGFSAPTPALGRPITKTRSRLIEN